jgi:L-ascorbate metabolism protein UlaG (beta-lactamase superfamily)
MFEEVELLTHSSIKISGKRVIYFDPFEVKEESHDADLIFITHEHHDHFSPEDIKKAANADTWIIMPEGMRGCEEKTENLKCKFVHSYGMIEAKGIMINAVPEYNRLKPFHTRGKGYVGYVVTIGDVRYYVAGDTDMTPENQDIKCDVALVPVGGKYTMDCREAAKFVNHMKPKLAVPTHYGIVAGSPNDGKRFAELVDSGIEVRIMI